jgi:uncharacterized damage-inducible protein DinB
MEFRTGLTREYTHESESTRKLLKRVPMDKLDWRPHEKSMSLGELATHIAEMPEWVSKTLDYPELDFAAQPYVVRVAKTTEELLKIHDDAVADALKSISNADNDKFMEDWTMRNGDQIFFTMAKVGVVRGFCTNHLYHHRGQLTVYLRLLNVPLVGMYGPTADDVK